MTALDSHKRRDLAFPVNPLNIVGGEREFEAGRVTIDNVVPDCVDHFQRAASGVMILIVLSVDKNGEELGADSAGKESGKVRVAIGGTPADIESGDGAAGDVVMCVDQQQG